MKSVEIEVIPLKNDRTCTRVVAVSTFGNEVYFTVAGPIEARVLCNALRQFALDFGVLSAKGKKGELQ